MSSRKARQTEVSDHGEDEGLVAGPRQAAAARTRQRLIDSGFALAESTGLAGLSVNLLVEHADVSKGTFFHHFGNRGAYVVALHRAFHDELQNEIARAVTNFPPGAERLAKIAATYLDFCLRRRGVRALLLEARADVAIRDEMASRNEAAGHIVAEDFKRLGNPLPAETARLWIGLVVEVALLELDEEGPLLAMRTALDDMARGSGRDRAR